MADQPMCTAATPKPVRDLELEAMQEYRALAGPLGPDWQELADTTRFMWVEHAEAKRRTAGVQGTLPPSSGDIAKAIDKLAHLVGYVGLRDPNLDLYKDAKGAMATLRAMRASSVTVPLKEQR